MPPKTAKRKQMQVSLEKARQAKRRCVLSKSSFEMVEIEKERNVEVVDRPGAAMKWVVGQATPPRASHSPQGNPLLPASLPPF